MEYSSHKATKPKSEVQNNAGSSSHLMTGAVSNGCTLTQFIYNVVTHKETGKSQMAKNQKYSFNNAGV